MRSKIILLACALLGGTAFTACEGIFDDLIGHGEFTISETEGENFYADSTTIDFASSISDCMVDDSAATYSNILLAALNLQSSDIIEEPYIAASLTDTLLQSYTIDCHLDLQGFAEFDAGVLLNTVMGHNMFILAGADTCWYIGYDGTVEIEDFPNYGYLMKCKFSDVKAYYITESKINYLKDLQRAIANGDTEALATWNSITVEEFFSHATFNGYTKSRRFPVADIVKSLL